jgi:hypothetical protein
MPEVAVVTCQVARVLGDRPLLAVTLGDLSRLPGVLAAAGLPPHAVRSAVHDLATALQAALGSGKRENGGESGIAPTPGRAARAGAESLGAEGTGRGGPTGSVARAPDVRPEEGEMGERERDDLDREGKDVDGHGQRIPGRDFAGASYASTEREQTSDRRGNSEGHRMDDAQNVGAEDQGAPRDES